MTDRDETLLELAAKAAGLSHPDGVYWIRNDAGDSWNPLTDDGDALRLAVKLCLFIQINTASVTAWLWRGEHWFEKAEDYEKDMSAATRRAITRAAAEIGRSMK